MSANRERPLAHAGNLVIDGKPMPDNLFQIVKEPWKVNPNNSVVAFKVTSGPAASLVGLLACDCRNAPPLLLSLLQRSLPHPPSSEPPCELFHSSSAAHSHSHPCARAVVPDRRTTRPRSAASRSTRCCPCSRATPPRWPPSRATGTCC
jgi:hypothetical protein